MNCEKTCHKILTGFFMAVIFIFMFLIMGQFIIKNVFIEVLHMDNFITDMSVTGKSDGMIGVDWEGLYPFIEEQEVEESNAVKQNPLLAKVKGVFNTIDKYSNDFLPFKEYVKIPSGYFDKLIDNHMVDKDNAYIKATDGTTLVRSPFYQEFSAKELNTDALVDNVVSLKDYLADSGIEFMYVQTPIKEDKYDEDYIKKYGLSYESQLADSLILGLVEENIDVLDLREELHKQGLDCYDSFFDTDNHWDIETAFWASGVIAQKLNEDYGFSFDMSTFDMSNYDSQVYEEWVQGTVGRSVTLANMSYDDISFPVPKFETNLTIKIPNLNMDKTGTYLETMINPVAFERRSTVYHGAYDAFAYSKPPITEVTNNIKNSNEGKSVLLLRESFAGPVITYMSLGIENLYAVTPEGFTGSIENYISQVNPDMVIVIYTAPTTNEVTTKYDFK